MLFGTLIVWYVLTAFCLIYVIWDFSINTPAGTVMKLAWVLVVAYTGPLGLLLYYTSCRQPAPGTHDAFIKAHWKQATGSLLHCVAGDATGIILAAVIVHALDLPNGLDLLIEYSFAYIVGLFVFQALFMMGMFKGNYRLAVRKSAFAETVSMNFVMIGMIPAMLILKDTLPAAETPLHLEFWGVMSLATIISMATAYPINSWLVRRGLKHGMMSARPKDESPQAGHGQAAHAPEAMPMDAPASHGGHAMHADMPGMEHSDSPAGGEHDAHAHGSHSDHSGHGSEAKHPHGEGAAHGGHASAEMAAAHEGHGGHGQHPVSLTVGQAVAWVIGSFAALGLVVWLTSFWVPITF